MARIVDYCVSVLLCALNAFFLYLWLGPKRGEGMVKGWAEAFGMLAITAVTGVIMLVYLGRLAWARYKKYPPPHMVTVNLIISAMAPVIVAFFAFLRSVGL